MVDARHGLRGQLVGLDRAGAAISGARRTYSCAGGHGTCEPEPRRLAWRFAQRYKRRDVGGRLTLAASTSPTLSACREPSCATGVRTLRFVSGRVVK
eukprot:1173909-Pleurochrysis_carterae.AAC.3